MNLDNYVSKFIAKSYYILGRSASKHGHGTMEKNIRPHRLPYGL